MEYIAPRNVFKFIFYSRQWLLKLHIKIITFTVAEAVINKMKFSMALNGNRVILQRRKVFLNERKIQMEFISARNQDSFNSATQSLFFNGE